MGVIASPVSIVSVLVDVHHTTVFGTMWLNWCWFWYRRSKDCLLWRLGYSDISLIFRVSLLLLKPVDQILERIPILVMEEESSWLDLDELTNQLFLWNVCQNQVLRILIKTSKLVRNSRCICLLLFLK